jgi:PKD repeat protein
MIRLLEYKKVASKFLIYTGFFLLFTFSSRISFSQVDNDFWFVVSELSHRGNTGGTPGTLRIATMELATTVTISMPANPYHPVLNPGGFQDIVINMAANSTAAVDLTYLIDVAANPTNNRLENKPLTPSGINNFGLHITATNLITVYWEVNYDYGADLWTLKGKNGIGTLFYTPFQTAYNNRNLTPRAYSAIDVVATQDNTQVTFTLPPGKAASYGSLLTMVAPGGTLTVTLNRGQTFSLFPLNYSVLAADRLAGTRVSSTAPIAVSVKDDAVAAGSQGQDVIGDQLVPVDIIGTNYIVPEVNNPNYIYVVATEDNTPIYVWDADGLQIGATSPYVTLNRGQQGLIVIPNGSKFGRITSQAFIDDPSAQPFYVFQVGLENQSRAGAIVPAIGCTGNTQLAFTRARADNKFYFFIIVEAGNEDKFLVDGVRNDGIIDPGAFTPILGSDGWVAQFSTSLNSNTLKVGQHLIQNTGGIFHLAIMNGFPGASQGRIYYGYYSDFGHLNIGAVVAGTNSQIVRACFGDDVQLYAYGGTRYQWTPDAYLDDATSNMPTAINLPQGPHRYFVEVSGACGSGIDTLDVVVSSPVVAFLETSASSGCSPLEIQFEDQSTGVYSWQYDLGDGSAFIRYDLDPATPYPPPPTYPNPFTITHTYNNTTGLLIDRTVTLLVKNSSGCANIFTKTITVFPEIHSAFSVDNDDGCDPLPVQFQNDSWGNTDTWEWEFGDGGSSIEQSPLHIFRNQFGPDNLTFQTRLIAISPYFCRDTSEYNITVRPYIEANFAFDTVAACTPHLIVISDQSYGADSYFWDFGDGTTSVSKGPTISKVFVNNTPNPVTYIIRLRVENEEGCWDTISRKVEVYPEIDAGFSTAPDEGCSPFEVTFQNSSVGAATYFWDFGDGGTSTQFQPIHLYDRNMLDHDTTFTVTLAVTSTELCRDTATATVVVHPYVEAAFTVDDIVGCHPFTITINNQSIGAEIYNWNFGDGTPTSGTSAASFYHTYSNTSGSTVTYTLRLIVRNTEGCSDTLIRHITVNPEITANFLPDATEGCHPMTVKFNDLSLNADVYYWDFGDGASSVEESPEHTFLNFGNSDSIYTVTLTTSSADGECVKTFSEQIVVHPEVIAEFTFPQTLDCNPFEVTFETQTSGGMTYTWNFGDGTIITMPNDNPVTHTFINTDFNNIKNFNVILRVENYAGCVGLASKTVSVYPDIQARFTSNFTEGCHPLAISFTNQSNGSQTYMWDFGDGTSSSLTNPSHTFTNTGTIDSIYTVILVATASNNACRDTFSIDITVHPYVLANFTSNKTLGCNPFDVVFENSSVFASTYHWDFGDGQDTITYNTNPIVHRFYNSDYANQQDYEITLVAESGAGCRDQISRTITVEPDIIAGFNASQVQGCQPLTVSFTNTSNGATYYHWDFGNGTTSQMVNTSQTFTNIGISDTTYRVWLYTTASNNVCRDSVYADILVHPYIKADFTVEENIQCPPSVVHFTNASVGGQTFNWDFDDGSDTTTNDMSSVVHTFSNSSFVDIALMQVTLTAENFAGCTSQSTRIVEVYPDIVAMFTPSVNEGCHPLSVNFDNLTNGGHFYLWDFGDGATEETFSPDHTFMNFTDAPVTRQVHLTTTSIYNCTSDITANITIHPKPAAAFEVSNIIGCPPLDVPIINTSINADQYRWVFGDGNVTNTTSPDPFNYIYENLGEETATYDLKLISSSDFGCVDSIQQRIFVYPHTIAAFTSDSAGCSPLTVLFDNGAVRGNSYLWDFGDGVLSTLKYPTHIFTNDGESDAVYDVQLTTISRFGCTDSVTRQVTVYPFPTPEFTYSPVYQYYPDATVTLVNETNDGNWYYLWDFGDGQQSDMGEPGTHTYSHWDTYNISLNVSNDHCAQSVTHWIRIFAPMPIADFEADIYVGCVPLTIRFQNNSIYGETYYWDFDDGGTSTDFEPQHTYTEPGLYQVRLSVTAEGGQDYAFREIDAYRLPEVFFTVEPDSVMLPDEIMKGFNFTKYADRYLWDFGDGTTDTVEDPVHLYTELGVYDVSLQAWTDHECTASMEIPEAIRVIGKGIIKFPNAFAPNLDGPVEGWYDITDKTNMIFFPMHEGVIEYELLIYTRWGELIFESHDVNYGWNGYHKGELCAQGVYIWQVRGRYSTGRTFKLTGDVTLLHYPIPR